MGAYAWNPHEGSRSEILADFLFTGWGTVTPVRRQDDHGLDLFCTLAERKGRLGFVREAFTVQVKSEGTDWVFKTKEEVEWLLGHPSPLLLCVVGKNRARVRVYHCIHRFMLALATPPHRLTLTPNDAGQGVFVAPAFGAERLDLGPPIIEVEGPEIFDPKRLAELRAVLAIWLEFERDNLRLRSNGLTRYRMPNTYSTNSSNTVGVEERGAVPAPRGFISASGLLTLAECLDCIGSQLYYRRDNLGTALACSMLRQLQIEFPEVFSRHARLGGMGALFPMSSRLKQVVRGVHSTAGVDHLIKRVAESPVFLAAAASAAASWPPPAPQKRRSTVTRKRKRTSKRRPRA